MTSTRKPGISRNRGRSSGPPLARYGAAGLGAAVRTTSFSPQELLLALLIRQVWQTNGIEIRLSDAMVFADLKKGHLSFREVIKLLAKQGTEIVEWDRLQ